MNRTTVLILALVLLLAHVLAMHRDGSGAFALPNDLAHVDFRIGRNAVHGQGTTWAAGSSAAAIAEEGGTSLIWILVAMVAELFATSPVRLSAVVGILSALLTLAVLSRLSRERLVGVTATVLLVVSGPFAASAADGTETALFTMLLAIAFFSLERRRAGMLGLSLALAVLTRSDGALMALGFLAVALAGRGSAARSLKLTRAFLPPLLALLLLVTIRRVHGAPALTPLLAATLSFDVTQLWVGLWSLEALVRGTFAPLLLLLPITKFFRGRLSGTGRRALALGALGTLLFVAQGASASPMHAAFVPVLPLLFLAVQEGFVSGLDRHPEREWMAWSGLALGCLASVLASKMPGDIGPLPTRELLQTMARENDVRREAFGHEWNGRLGVIEALSDAERLRAVGLFLRDHTAPDSTILSPWPGAIGYLSRRRVIDLLGRTSRVEGGPTAPWVGRRRADVVAALETRPGYIVPMVANQLRPPSQAELIETWLERFDSLGPTPERRAAMAAALAPYELVAVPTAAREADLNAPSETPGFLLRHRALGLAPVLNVERQAGRLVVRVTHTGHHQIAELEVQATASDGTLWYLRPTGVFAAGTPLRARTKILLFPTGDHQVQLIATQLPSELLDAELTVRLVNPYSDSSDPLARVSAPVRSLP